MPDWNRFLPPVRLIDSAFDFAEEISGESGRWQIKQNPLFSARFVVIREWAMKGGSKMEDGPLSN